MNSRWYSNIRTMSVVLTMFIASSCYKADNSDIVQQGGTISFGVDGVAQTKVNYNGVDATFANTDKLGLYAFYNNFYLYHEEYSTYAESVIFSNQLLTFDESGDLGYAPKKSWTFSTIYGTAPNMLDVMAYYPYGDGTTIEKNKESDANAYPYVLRYSYLDDNGAVRNADFMTSHIKYTYPTTSSFRDAMLALDYIPLTFTRQMASMNFKVTKPKGYTDAITVTGVKVIFDANKTLEVTLGGDDAFGDWSDMSENHSLSVATTCNTTLGETDDTYIPGTQDPPIVNNLLSDEDMLFFPPDTKIWEVIFTITVGSDTSAKSYSWHAHVGDVVANTHYSLNLELDPSRAN